MDLAQKRAGEQQIMAKMVAMYCRGQRHDVPKGELCPACGALLAYAHRRTECCPRMEQKTFCSKCPHPCYSVHMRERVRAVMRYAGPRMLWHSPLLMLRHVLARGRGGG